MVTELTSNPLTNVIAKFETNSENEGWFNYAVHVYPHHTDYSGVVWHGTYLTWMEAARVECLRSVGMSFEELINKTRVEYFVEIIKEPKVNNYTVEALAMEVGFSSRQRFYQPFKKYHGGNPSDLINILND